MPDDAYDDYRGEDTSPHDLAEPAAPAEPAEPVRLTFPRCVLEVVEGPDLRAQVASDRSIVRVGGSQRCDLVLQDPLVSRVHIELRHVGDRWLLVDRDSTNGTFVGDLQVVEIWVNPGTELRLGDTRIEFRPTVEEVVVEPTEADRFEGLIGGSPRMRALYGLLEQVGPLELSLLVEGEVGTGKELVARAVHERSPRRRWPLVVFDCSAFPRNLLETELFGHEKGAVSTAVRTQRGVLERAHGGTLFLVEAAELDLPLQPRLLEALETGAVRRVGGERPVEVDVRLITASSHDLSAMVEDGAFRSDLFQRLAAARVRVPALRERPEDIQPLVEHFLDGLAEQDRDGSGGTRCLSAEALDLMLRYDWPGNVGELRNVVERAASFAPGEEILPEDLPTDLSDRRLYRTPVPSLSDTARLRLPFKDAREQVVSSFERDYVVELLRKHDMNIALAARAAGLDRRHIYRLLQKYEIPLPRR